MRAGEVGDVGVVLVREHRVAGETELLGALDLAVPVGALDQPHHEAQTMRASDARHLLDHRQRAGLVGLDGKAEPAPGRMRLRDARRQCFEDVERELQAVALLGVDGEVEVGARRGVDQRPHPWQQFGEHAFALRHFVAREQCAELDRDAVRVLGPAAVLRLRDARDRLRIGGVIALRIGFGTCAFTEHVVAEAQGRSGAALAACLAHRLADVLAEHELPAEQLNGTHRGRHHCLRAEPLEQTGFVLGVGQKALGQLDCAGRQAGEHAMRSLAVVCIEARLAELVGGQCDGGLGIGHTQQRLGQPHQRQTLGAGDGVLAQQRLHGPEGRRLVAHRRHPGGGAGGGAGPFELARQPRERGSQRVVLGTIRVGQAGGLGRRSEHGGAP